MAKYYIHLNNQQGGPYTIDQLKDLDLKTDTPIWHEGLSEWTIVSKIPEVNRILHSTPPPLNASTESRQTPPQMDYIDDTPKSKKVLHYIITLLILGAIAFGGFYFFYWNAQEDYSSSNYSTTSPSTSYTSPEPTYEEKVVNIAEQERSQPEAFLSVENTYRINLRGKVKINGSITNSATAAGFKDVVLRITFLSKTNTVLGSKDRVIYENFPPNSRKDFFVKIHKWQGTKTVRTKVISATPN